MLQALYDRHFPAVSGYVVRNSGTVRDAQDVFQEAMTVLWLNAREGRVRVDGPEDLGAYLFRVAKNKWLDVLRSTDHRNMRVAMESDDLVQMPAEVNMDRTVEDRIAGLRSMYGRLDERCRTVLDQFYFERKDLTIIAEGLGVDVGSIRTIKYRCMMKLRGMKEAAVEGTSHEERRS